MGVLELLVHIDADAAPLELKYLRRRRGGGKGPAASIHHQKQRASNNTHSLCCLLFSITAPRPPSDHGPYYLPNYLPTLLPAPTTTTTWTLPYKCASTLEPPLRQSCASNKPSSTHFDFRTASHSLPGKQASPPNPPWPLWARPLVSTSSMSRPVRTNTMRTFRCGTGCAVPTPCRKRYVPPRAASTIQLFPKISDRLPRPKSTRKKETIPKHTCFCIAMPCSSLTS